jgi:hypothetical protein
MEAPDLIAQFNFGIFHFRLALNERLDRSFNEVRLLIRFDGSVAGWARSPIANTLAHDSVETYSAKVQAG